MSLVHHALQTLSARLGRALQSLALLGCCAALASGCASAARSSTLDEHSSVDVGESARSDTCEEWEKGTRAERHGAVVRLHKFAESPVGSSEGLKNGHVLSEKQADGLFTNLCAKHFARAFKLYKLYERAAAFVGH